MRGPEVQIPEAYQTGANTPIPMPPAPEITGDLSHDISTKNDRLQGPTAALTAGTLASVAFLAGCTDEQLRAFEERTGFDIPQPIEEKLTGWRMPEPTDPIVVPTPEPTPKPKTVEDLFKAKGNPKPPQVTRAINTAFKNNPAAENLVTKEDIDYIWRLCRTGEGLTPRESRPNMKGRNRLNSCNILVIHLFNIFNKTGDEQFYKASVLANNFSLNILPRNYRGLYRRSVEEFFSPPKKS